MRNFRNLSLTYALFALSAGCGTFGDPCLRMTDCGSGLVCVEGKCVVDVGDNPADGAPPSDVIVSGDASTSDAATIDQSSTPDTSSDGSSPPPADSPVDSTDSPRDGDASGDTARLDATDALSTDTSDARASADGDAAIVDPLGGDVGNDADSGLASDALASALDATG